mmetsp:Transcript_48297/g.154659  ORF Transcript_48297/g.154659 Transcript_48297/m.154659 type:complete len:261 (-) Transcript_48297:73-855(-)
MTIQQHLNIEEERVEPPTIRTSYAKYVVKGEDMNSIVANREWTVPGSDAATTYTYGAVFDGHGGKQAAKHAQDHLHNNVAEFVNEHAALDPSLGDDIPAEVKARRALHSALYSKSAAAAFRLTDTEFNARSLPSGSTATAVWACGWLITVASVGDSHAILDTGHEVTRISADHRLDTNKEERERVKAEGSAVDRASVDGKACGPLRVWPGGLAMSRTLGDREGGPVVSAEPELAQYVIPEASGGARVIIASDGLWDAVNA